MRVCPVHLLQLDYSKPISLNHLVTPDVFANNRLSLCLVSTHPMSAKIDTATYEGQLSAGVLAEYLVTPDLGHSIAMNEAAFQYTKRGTPHEQSLFFDWLGLPVSDFLKCIIIVLTSRSTFRNKQSVERYAFICPRCTKTELDRSNLADR